MAFRVNSPRVIHETIDDEVVLIDFESGSYFSLAGSAAEIWQLVIAGQSASDIPGRLLQRYDGDPVEMTAAVDRLLHDLLLEQLIVADTQLPEPQKDPVIEPASDRTRFEPPKLLKYTDMQQLLLLDPIHEVHESGWPTNTTEPTRE